MNPELKSVRPMYWSLRRELWESRSVYLAPLIVAAVVLFASLIGTSGLPQRVRTASALSPDSRHAVVVMPFSIVPAPIMLTTLLVGLFYSLDALYGERRDRSILFWKSLPVSDRTTVLAKALIPIVVLPLIGFVLSVAAVFIALLAGTAVLLANGMSPALLWAELRFIQHPIVMLYGLLAHALWFAPIYAWLLLISAWARRAPFLWAVLPPVALLAVERILFDESRLASLLTYRLSGAMEIAFRVGRSAKGEFPLIDRVAQLDPLKFLSTPGLWVGLVLAAAFLAAAVRLRRNREPI